MPQPSRPTPRRAFALGGRITTAEYLGIAALVFAVLALAWFGFTLGGFIRPLFLPSPGQVLSRLAELWASGQLFADIGIFDEVRRFMNLHEPAAVIHMEAQPLVVES